MTVSFFEKLKNKIKIQHHSLEKNNALFEQNNVVSRIFFIKSGRVKLTRHSIDGSPIILHVGQMGEFIAEASLFSEYYHCTAIADQASEIQSISKKDFLLFIEENPQEMKTLLSLFANQVRDLRALNEIKNIKSANERILTYFRSKAVSDNNKNASKFPVNTSLKDIAYKIGLTHETFYRELKKLEKSNIILREDEWITLL